jgi:O-antigen/teichoic acid export membrane protein
VVGCVVLWSVSAWRPRLRFWGREARDLAGFAARASVSSVAVFLNNRVDAALIGVYFGATAVGLYRLAARLVESVLELTVQPLQHVALPELARSQTHPGRAQARYRALVLTATTLVAPVIACVFAAAEPLLALLGDEWSAAATPLQLLCIVGIVRAITMLNGSALQAAGRPGLQATMTWTAALFSCVAFVFVGRALTERAIDVQVVGIAASRAILYSLVLLPLAQFWFGSRIFGTSLGALSAVSGRMFAQVLAVWGVPSLLRLVLVCASTLSICLVALRTVNPEARRAFSIVIGRLRGRTVEPVRLPSNDLGVEQTNSIQRTDT